MKGRGALAAIGLAVTLVACGGSSSSMNTADGAWSETLSSSTGQQLGSFTFTVTQNDAALTGRDMDFTNIESLAQCFRTGTVMNGLIQQGMMNGSTLIMTMWWTAPNNTGANSMYMKGNIAMGTGSGSGTFTLAGQAPGCTSDQGTFTMTQVRWSRAATFNPHLQPFLTPLSGHLCQLLKPGDYTSLRRLFAFFEVNECNGDVSTVIVPGS